MKKVSKLLSLLLLSGALGLSACNSINFNETSSNDSNGRTTTSDNGKGDTGTKTSDTGPSAAAKEAFKKLNNLADFNVNIQNATSLGLSKSTKTASAKRAVDSLTDEFETKYTMVKTTTDYSAEDPTVDENGELGVSFSKVDTTVTTTVTDGQKTLIAGLKEGDNDEVIVTEYGEDTITFKSDTRHKYRVVDAEGNEVIPWFQGSAETTETPDLPVNHSLGWGEFELWQRAVTHYDSTEEVGTFNFNNSDWATSHKAYFYRNAEYPGDHYTYKYRLVDGDGDNPTPVTDWESFDEYKVSGGQTYFDLTDLTVTNPRYQRKTIREEYEYFEEGYKTSSELTPTSQSSVKFWASTYWDSNNNYRQYWEYCLKDKAGNIIVDWTRCTNPSGTSNSYLEFENVPYVAPITTKHFVVEAKSIDAIVTYPAYEGFTYTLEDKDGHVLVDAVTADNAANVSTDETLVVFDGLVEGERYTLKYHGVGQETTVEQTKVGGEIDKMYVYSDQFTFVSFVPYGTSKRPIDAELKYESDGIANYDKRDYYSDSTRQSFIFDNYSGYIYLIKNFRIKYIHNNLLLSSSDNKVYDFKINEDNSLEIFALFNNTSLNYMNFFKDKYGNNVIQNDKIDKYDAETNTYYFVAQANQDQITRIMTAGEFSSTQQIYDEMNNVWSENADWEVANAKQQELSNLVNKINQRNNNSDLNDSGYRYYLTSNKETLFLRSYPYDDRAIKEQYLIIDNSTHRDLTVRDNFYNLTSCGWNEETIKASKGYIFSLSAYYPTTYNYTTNRQNEKGAYGQINGYIFFKNLATNELYCTQWDSNYNNYYNLSFITKYDTMLIYSKRYNTLYKWTFGDISNYVTGEGSFGFRDEEDGDQWVYAKGLNIMKDVIVVREDVSLDETYSNFVTYDVNGTTNYEIVVEEKNGELEVTPYVSGTYVAPVTKIVLQPINR